MLKSDRLGDSATARSYGAGISVTLPAQGMYLLIGRHPSLAQLVRGMGGQVMLHMSARKLLAILPVTTFLAFQRHADILFAGPVALDRERFAQFTALLGQAASPNPSDGAN